MKSWLVFEVEPSGLGAASATPAPWTRAIAAIARAPVITPTDRSDRCGRTSGGRPLGIAPTSETVSMSSFPVRTTTTVGTTTATSDANSAKRVRLSPNITISAESPTAAEGRLIPDGWVTTYPAFARATPPSVDAPSKAGNWPSTMLTPTPVRKPSMTDLDTNRTYRPRCSRPAASITRPVRTVRVINARSRSAGANPSSAEAAANEAVVVVVTTINLVLVLSPPPILPANDAYRP